ncbi:MAG: cytochrome P460 family protein [Nitrospirae bacterium]|nr:cytochrome P460 family protein [Nitrospirota bacterium]
MKRFLLFALLVGVGTLIYASGAWSAKHAVAPAPNGIAIPEGYKNWRVIAPSQRTDNNTIRVVLGNDVAMEAARAGKTKPWPDGAILGKIVWKNKTHENWPTAIVPGPLVHAEFMIKDSKKYAATGGWGFARWLGMDQKPYGKDATFVQECFGCHTPVKESDYVFTHPGMLP